MKTTRKPEQHWLLTLHNGSRLSAHKTEEKAQEARKKAARKWGHDRFYIFGPFDGKARW